MLRTTTLFLTVLLTTLVFGQVDTANSKFWMMTYFVNGQDNDGPRLAFSSDTTGIQWQIYSNSTSTNPLSSSVLFKPVALPGADGSRCRDPMIAYDSVNHRFNMVWTTEWTGKVIGWDTSSLLKPGTWGQQMPLAVGTSMNASFSWAPEIFRDDIQNKWMLYWSVSVSGKTTCIYYAMVTGTDFRNFSTPAILFNPGYDVIDADIIKVGPENYQLFFKDERNGYKYIRRASGAKTPQGPYPTVSAALSGGSMEGPSIVKQGGEYHLFIDNYSNKGINRISAKDIETATLPWSGTMTKYGTGNTDLKVSHCNVIEVPKALVKWMLYNDSAWVRIVNNITGTQRFGLRPGSSLQSPAPRNDVTTFDINGRIVRLISGGATQTGGECRVLPAGCYVTNRKDEHGAAVKSIRTK